MIKKILIAPYLFSVSIILSEGPMLPDKDVLKFISLIQKRFYLVRRVEKPIRVLLTAYNDIGKNNFFNLLDLFIHNHNREKSYFLETSSSFNFEHAVIKNYIQKIKTSQNLEPIKDLWTDFLSYKYLESDLFVKETVLIMIILYRQLIDDLSKQDTKSTLYTLVELEEFTTNLSKTINIIDRLSSNNAVNDGFIAILDLLDESYVQGNFIIQNNLRFYHIQRMLKSMAILSKVNVNEFYTAILPKIITYFDKLEFKNIYIKECIIKMKKQSSTGPLIDLWHQFTAYKFIDDTLFLKEFLMVTILIYKNLIIASGAIKKDQAEIEQILALYNEISLLQLPDLLNSLDSIVEQFIDLMEKYELNSTMSWSHWLKKYWWLAPVIATSLYIRFYLLKDTISMAKN